VVAITQSVADGWGGRAKFAAQPYMARIGDPFFSYAPAGDERDADA